MHDHGIRVAFGCPLVFVTPGWWMGNPMLSSGEHAYLRGGGHRNEDKIGMKSDPGRRCDMERMEQFE